MTGRARSLRVVGAFSLLTALAVAVAPDAAGARPTTESVSASGMAWLNTTQSADRRADELGARMTLVDKINLVTGVFFCAGGADGFVLGDPLLGLPNLNLVGAGAGVTDVCHRIGDGRATLLPAPIAMAASWSPALAYRDGALIGRETRDLGFNVAIGGDVNLARDPRNGRTFEGEGEDPVLAGTMVAAQIRGTQSQHIPATIKHFAMNDEEAYRNTQSSNVDQRTMRELELRAFQIGVQQGHPGAVMCSYNKVNGVPACADKFLLDTVLKHDWGFKGWVMTDWWACLVPLCPTAATANAGLDQEQPNTGYFGPALLAAIADGSLSQARLDDMVHRILRSLFASGLMDYPVVAHPIDVARGAAMAERVEEQSAVLLKNAHDQLPLSRRTTKRIAVIGAPANAVPPEPTGAQSSATVDPIDPDTPLGGLRDIDPKATITYNDGSKLASAVALARSSQVAIVYAKDTEGEATNRTNLSLDPGSDALIKAVVAANRHTIVVLMSGSAVTMPWLRSVSAVLEAWYPGERGGHAIAHLLFGDVNPSGALPMTFPRGVSQLPTAKSTKEWPGTAANINYDERLDLGYRWYDAKNIKPLFPFGFGLTYGGRFTTSGAVVRTTRRVAPQRIATSHRLGNVSFTVTNRGERRAAAIPQAYVGFPAAVGEPPLRLFGWHKIWLRPGQSRRITLPITDSALDFWSTKHNKWAIAAGRYPVRVGFSNERLSRAGKVSLA